MGDCQTVEVGSRCLHGVEGFSEQPLAELPALNTSTELVVRGKRPAGRRYLA